jgi:predicted transposase/invertase (TIGR01784 family)
MREDGLHDYNSDINSAERRGITKGRTEEKREAALSMLSDGMPIASVSKYTGLSSSEVQSLKPH